MKNLVKKLKSCQEHMKNYKIKLQLLNKLITKITNKYKLNIKIKSNN
jgi:hypothetical protein